MRTIEPSFYQEFRCIADQCPITCCREWKITVDDKTRKNWKKKSDAGLGIGADDGLDTEADAGLDTKADAGLNTEVYDGLGTGTDAGLNTGTDAEKTEVKRRLSSYLYKKEGQSVILLNHQGNCPFLNDRKLCKLVLKWGDAVLSDTCRTFPRQTHEFDNCREYALVACCPAVIDLLNESGWNFLESDTWNNILDTEHKIESLGRLPDKQHKIESPGRLPDTEHKIESQGRLQDKQHEVKAEIQHETEPSTHCATEHDEALYCLEIRNHCIEFLQKSEEDRMKNPDKQLVQIFEELHGAYENSGEWHNFDFLSKIRDIKETGSLDIAETLAERNEIFMDICENYMKEQMYQGYLKEIMLTASELEKYGITEAMEKKYEEFLWEIDTFTPLFYRYLCLEFYTDSVIPGDTLEDMILNTEWIFIEYTTIRHALFLYYCNPDDKEQRLTYERVRDYMVIISRMTGYDEEDIHDYLADCFEHPVWPCGYAKLLLTEPG